MLNRRILRIKVMQAIYGYLQIEQALYHHGKNRIAGQFQPDLTAEKASDPLVLEGMTKLALLHYDEVLNAPHITPQPDMPKEAWKAAEDARLEYQQGIARERDRVLAQVLDEAQALVSYYAEILLLLPALARHVLKDEQEKQNRLLKPEPALPWQLKLAHHPLLTRLEEHQPLRELAIRSDISWERNNAALLRQIYEEDLVTNETYQAYIDKTEVTHEEQVQILVYLVRHVLFKSTVLDAYYNERDLYWAEDKEVVKNMAVRTLKTMESPGAQPELTLLSTDWEEDREFVQMLFKQTLAHRDEYEAFVGAHTPNWAFNRLAATDRIILMLALSEFQYLPNIPRKVTINEYIEVAKLYSTPDSKKFINGVLDTLADQLAKEGKLRKSARGMLEG